MGIGADRMRAGFSATVVTLMRHLSDATEGGRCYRAGKGVGWVIGVQVAMRGNGQTFTLTPRKDSGSGRAHVTLTPDVVRVITDWLSGKGERQRVDVARYRNLLLFYVGGSELTLAVRTEQRDGVSYNLVFAPAGLAESVRWDRRADSAAYQAELAANAKRSQYTAAPDKTESMASGDQWNTWAERHKIGTDRRSLDVAIRAAIAADYEAARAEDEHRDLHTSPDSGATCAPNCPWYVAPEDDECGQELTDWPYGHCTEPAGHAGDCDRRSTRSEDDKPTQEDHDLTDAANRAVRGLPIIDRAAESAPRGMDAMSADELTAYTRHELIAYANDIGATAPPRAIKPIIVQSIMAKRAEGTPESVPTIVDIHVIHELTYSSVWELFINKAPAYAGLDELLADGTYAQRWHRLHGSRESAEGDATESLARLRECPGLFAPTLTVHDFTVPTVGPASDALLPCGYCGGRMVREGQRTTCDRCGYTVVSGTIVTDTSTESATGLVCGYCGGDAVESSLAGIPVMVHATDGERVANIGPGDFVSARHNRAGTPIMSYDLVKADEADQYAPQTTPADTLGLTLTVNLSVDLAAWADDYGMTPEESGEAITRDAIQVVLDEFTAGKWNGFVKHVNCNGFTMDDDGVISQEGWNDGK